MEVETKQLYFFIILTALSLKINASPVTEDGIDTPPMNTTLGVAVSVDRYPNIIYTTHGVDIAKKNPFVDESDRDHPIFIHRDPTSCNDLLAFISVKNTVKCTSTYEEKSWGSYKEYAESSSTSSISSFSMGFTAPDATLSVSDPSGIASMEVTPVPNAVNVGNGKTDSSLDLEYFFSQEGGSVSRSRFACDIYKVTYDIDNPKLTLHNGFIHDIKRIDQAETETEKKAVMQNFIDKYGTHYAKTSIMGVGMEFETRYNREETRDNTVEQRNKCSSESGGFSFAGIGASTQSTECKSFNAGEKNAASSSAKRAEYISYGVLPSEGFANLGAWGDRVQEMWTAGTLSPMPIKQDLVPIYKILLTNAVKDIDRDVVRDDGSKKIDHEKVLKTAVSYYSQYCTIMGDCDFPVCPETVLLDGDYYHKTVFENQGRNRYDNVEKGMSLQYREGEFTNSWVVVDSNNLSDVKKKTAPCPTVGGKFVSVSKPLKHVGSTTWKECSINCQNYDKCNFWQYRKIDKHQECRLFEDFDSIHKSDAPADSDPANDYHIGSKDCPGDDKVSQSSFGQCPHTFKAKSMWIEDGTFFNKNSRVTDVQCPGNGACSNQGTCDYSTGTCVCDSGYQGDMCQEIVGCNDYKILNEAERNHQVKTSGSAWCDKTGYSYTNPQWHGDDWYRFLPPAGTRIAEEAPGIMYCGTGYPGWMQGSHPTSLGETVTRTMCFQLGSTCQYSTVIKVRNCGQFFLYRLVDTPLCYLGYCAK